jgi:formylglycine-generating enzyme required for sulfatase activity
MPGSGFEEIAPARFDDGDVIRPAPFSPPPAASRHRGVRAHPALLSAAALVVVTAAAAWFVLTSRAVQIVTVPEDAVVEVSARLKLQFGGRLLLRPGAYDIAVRAEGYRTRTGRLVVSTDQSQRHTFALEKLPGKLRVDSRPEGAAVTVDGTARGRTPLLVENLAAGPHAVRLEHDRYRPLDATVEIEGLGKAQSTLLVLEPAWAEITIASAPPGAEVFVDDERIGATPLTAEILEGARALRVQLPGFKPHRQALEVVAGRPQTLPEIVLAPADAVLLVRSRPEGASVTLDGVFQGRTPVELALTPGAAGSVRLFRDGYAAAERTVKLASGERRTLEVALDADMAEVEIRATPPDAELVIDGAAYGDANQVVRLNTRPHAIRIHKPGYVAHETTITPRAGIAQSLRVKLMTEAEARLAAIKPRITSAGGQVLQLFRPDGAFTLGASRREAGRRANEALRAVILKRPFYLAVKEVTNAEFKAFDPTHGSGEYRQKNLDGANQPVVNVTWERAALYCNWLSGMDGLQPFYQVRDGHVIGATPGAAGYRLPSEAEWEWAARYRTGAMVRFAWGEALPPPAKAGNFADQSAVGLVAQVLEKYEDGYPVSAPVGSFAASDKGLYDLDGNVAEWVHDWYDVPVEQSSPMTDPLGPAGGQHHVIRGASWAHGTLTELRLSFRDYGADGRDDVGFRIARYLE